MKSLEIHSILSSKINNANEDPHIDFRVGEEDSSLKYANNNYQNTKI